VIGTKGKGKWKFWSDYISLKVTPKSVCCAQNNVGVKKVLAPAKYPVMYFARKKNNIPHFQNQQYINSYNWAKHTPMLAYIDTTSNYHSKRGNTTSKEWKGCCQNWVI
jgi:hypothetical protein